MLQRHQYAVIYHLMPIESLFHSINKPKAVHKAPCAAQNPNATTFPGSRAFCKNLHVLDKFVQFSSYQSIPYLPAIILNCSQGRLVMKPLSYAIICVDNWDRLVE